MRAIRVDLTGHTPVIELSPEHIAEMGEEERQQEIARLRKWAAGEINKGRLVVAVQEQGADGVQVRKGETPSLDVFQYESHEPLVGG